MYYKKMDLVFWENEAKCVWSGFVARLMPMLPVVALLVCFALPCTARQGGFTVRGRVVDALSRRPVPFAVVSVYGESGHGASADSLGVFAISGVTPGMHRLSASCMGYKDMVSDEFLVSATLPPVVLELEEDASVLAGVTVSATPLRIDKVSPVSLHLIGMGEIEKSPGGNRDISRIVRSYPGVSFSPIGYRNDLIVRGGSPSENRFFLDGIEIPNINHFATQGATGGPVSILNADFIREVQFYTGAFPADKGGALSSVLDIRLRDGNAEGNNFKATLGASEVSLSASGHVGRRTTYLFSVRQSYLQLLFKMIGLPFLPNFIDGQFKVKTRFSEHDELTVLGLAGIDDMKLNTDEEGEDAEYLLSYLPRIKQNTFTVGAAYKHYSGRNVTTVSLGYNYLYNSNLKYRDNDDSSPDNLTLDISSHERKVSLRAENRTYGERWTVAEGADVYYARYDDNSFQRLYAAGGRTDRSQSAAIGMVGWGAYASARYKSSDERLTASAGLRFDGCGYSLPMARVWDNVSPTLSVSWRFVPSVALNAAVGLYHQLPPYTALGYKASDGSYANKGLRYMRVANANVGAEWNVSQAMVVSLEGFYKQYSRLPLSVADGIPLSCKGNDYGIVGNELLTSTAEGRAFGLEASLRWQKPGRFVSVASVTLYRSEFRDGSKGGAYVASAWDNRFIANVSGTYELPRNWSVGAKLSAIGGGPLTPYDVDKSSLVEAWDAQGRPYLDYSRYNTGRLDAFCQLDVRVDKNYYFRSWRLGIYVDLQNVTKSVLRQPDVLMSTGIVENPGAPVAEQRYRMKYLPQDSGTLLPTIGLTVEF